MSFIFLISDFQNGSYKTGLLKADLHKKINDISIIDITHQIRLNNTIEAAFVCRQLRDRKLQNDIVLVKVGSTREQVVYPDGSNLYIFPNNGLISMVFEQADKNRIRLVPAGLESDAILRFREGKVDELPAAGEKAQFSLNKSLQTFDGMALAECLYSDGHGNCYFNIRENEFLGFINEKPFQIRIQHYTGQIFKRIHRHITEVSPGDALFRFSSSGYLKLQIRLGNARQLFRIKDDTKIIIETQ